MKWLIFSLMLLSSLMAQPVSRQQLLRGVAFLEHIQRADGAICDSLNPLFDTWETILATAAIYAVFPDSSRPSVRKALGYLRSQTDDGGFVCHNRRCRGGYCLETTAEYRLLLRQMGVSCADDSLAARLARLQLATGEWEIGNPGVREQKSFPSVTAFVLLMADAAIVLSPMQRQQALDWLLARQTADGHWGTAWEYYGCPGYALWPVLRLPLENPAQTKALQHALIWLKNNQAANGSWPLAGEKPSTVLHTALIANGLKSVSLPDASLMVAAAVQYIAENQKINGSWEGGLFPIPSPTYQKAEYVTATALCLKVLAASVSP